MDKRIITLKSKYESKVYLIDDKKLIYKLDCTCGDFIHRRITRDGKFSDIKIYETPCKHLRTIVEALESQGYTLRKPKPMTGTDRCTAKLRRFIMERSQGLCEVTGCEFQGADIHRIIQGKNGGKYNKSNCKLLCKNCHKNMHFHGQ